MSVRKQINVKVCFSLIVDEDKQEVHVTAGSIKFLYMKTMKEDGRWIRFKIQENYKKHENVTKTYVEIMKN